MMCASVRHVQQHILIFVLMLCFMFLECESNKTMYHNCRQRYDCAREDYVSLEPPAVFHSCNVRYDCLRKEYTSILPALNTTYFTTLSVLLQVGIQLSMLSFNLNERILFREAVASKFNIPTHMVSIINVSESQSASLQTSVQIGTGSQEALTSSDTCMLVDCTQVHIYASNLEFALFPKATIIELPTCKLCASHHEFVFASSGTRDDPFSCRKECAAGFFQFGGLETSTCEHHSEPQCLSGQFLSQGTPTTDAFCKNCSSCEGFRLVAPCSEDADTVCEICPEAGAHKFYVGIACTPACEKGFVLDFRTDQCEFCNDDQCHPGWRDPPPPEVKHNCSHCVSCPPHPENAHWNQQHDRFDCMWACNDHCELHTVVTDVASEELTCRCRNVVVENIELLQPVCVAGHFALNFKCVPCFEAAALGHVLQKNLPQPTYQNIRWEWIYECKWRCLHVAGYWELRPETGIYWECAPVQIQREMVRGVDLSWTDSNITKRRVIIPENKSRTLLSILGLLAVIILGVIVLCAGYNCLCLCLKSGETQEISLTTSEQKALLGKATQ